MNILDSNKDETTETMLTPAKPALAEFATLLASTLLMGCQARGEIDKHDHRDTVNDGKAVTQP